MYIEDNNITVKNENGYFIDICLENCKNIADIIEFAKNKLGNYGKMQLVMKKTDIEFGEMILQPQKSLQSLFLEYPDIGTLNRSLILRNCSKDSFYIWRLAKRTYQGLSSIEYRKIYRAIYNEVHSIHWYTLLFILRATVSLSPFKLFSAVGFLIFTQITTYILLLENTALELTHFTPSIDNIRQGRYWILITSIFAHEDVNHLIGNIAGLMIYGSVLEDLIGQQILLCIFFGWSVFSNAASLMFLHDAPIGSDVAVFSVLGWLVGYTLNQNIDS
jgi:membrane associated rhomboid family serine protease